MPQPLVLLAVSVQGIILGNEVGCQNRLWAASATTDAGQPPDVALSRSCRLVCWSGRDDRGPVGPQTSSGVLKNMAE
jgi:hypothetical protein